jgi:formylglycine-generating enzyme required for sulfatase activity
MGKADADSYANDDEKPRHTVALDAFWIDQTEVTNAQYRRCVEAGTCPEPSCERYWEAPTYSEPAMANYPVVCVDWHDAKAYCGWAGVRLPTEAEWEKAARGTDGRRYPWGNTFDGSRVNFCDRTCEYDYGNTDAYDGYPRTAPVGSFPGGASPYGALDMVGNVSEWVVDWYDASYYNHSPARNPQGPDSGVYKVLRGGSWHTREVRVHTACRAMGYPSSTYFNVGFRCAQQCE